MAVTALAQKPPRAAAILRWTARIWGVLITAFWLLVFFSPGSLGPGPIAREDVFLLSLTGIAFVGLLAGWCWEREAGIFTLAVLFIREIFWVILKGGWLPGFLILWLTIAPPAVMFLIAARLSRRAAGA